MPDLTRVDLHCHSRHSDGTLWPEQVAAHLAAHGVVAAALTDHDTLDGQAAFRQALARHGIGCVTAVELTTQYRGQEVHLLGYGFDPGHDELRATLASLHQARQRSSAVASIADDVRARTAPSPDPRSAAPNGHLACADGIALIHRAGGKAFLAHPMDLSADPQELRTILRDLRAGGLDGIEAIYGQYSRQLRDTLVRLAREEHLLVSAGTDLHDPSQNGGPAAAGIEIPTAMWKAFRDAVANGTAKCPAGAAHHGPVHRHDWRRFVLHIILPTALAIVLFAVAIWGFFLPAFEQSLLDRKREMIRELTQSAWSVLAEAHRAELAGELSREAAQRLAAQRIAAMRYGREQKDYFWVQDLTPRMVMHPYRPDLNGQDMANFRDPRGARIFVEFADLVRRQDAGYVAYVWQWKDDPQRLVPKESYIQAFAPWGWAIGTGIYIDDVKQEIARLERGLVYGSLIIIAVVALLLLHVMRETLHIERDRSAAEEHLRETTQRYQSLVEASTEGALLVIGNRCRYANPVLLKLLSRSQQELELLDVDDLLPQSEANAEPRRRMACLLAGEEVPTSGVEAKVRRADGRLLDCVLSFSPIRVGDKSGLVLLVKDLSTLPRPVLSHETIVRDEDGRKLAVDIASADSPEQVIRLCRRVPNVVTGWLAGGMYPRHIARQIADVCDAATARFVTLAQAQLGAPPAPFAFIAMGSQGRQEQTLFTDQDNAIVIADDASDAARARAYFLDLGARVCQWLDEAGYSFCRGQVMARSDHWCQPLSNWTRSFRDWIAQAEPQELLDLCIAFDLRTVCGDAELERTVRHQIHQAVAQAPQFLPHFAHTSLLFKPPMRLFGHIMSTGGEHPGLLDLKQAMTPIVNFARFYALRHQLAPTATLDRLCAMTQRDVLVDTTRRDLSYAYEFLMRLRLEHQVRCLQAAQPPDNSISLRHLSHTEQTLLKEAFTQIDAVQKRISYEFLGGTS